MESDSCPTTDHESQHTCTHSAAARTARFSGRTSKNWVFTIHANEVDETVWPVSHDCPIDPPAGYKFMMCQVERAPTTGKLHIQGFMCMTRAIGMRRACQILGGHCHVEIMRGRIEDNELYCGKDETQVRGPWKFGTPPQQGKRTDWAAVKELCALGKSEEEIYTEAPHLANCCRGVDKLRTLFGPKPPTYRDVRVIVMYGAPGTGKSHRGRITYPDAYCITGKYHEGKSFDGYTCERCLILDEWRDWEWPLTFMNSVLDKWKLMLQCRYNNKYAQWDTVIVITNDRPDYVYAADASAPSFQRRIKDRVFEIRSIDDPEINLLTC